MVITSASKPADPNEETLHWLRCIELGKTVYRPPLLVRKKCPSRSGMAGNTVCASLGCWLQETQGMEASGATMRTPYVHMVGRVQLFYVYTSRQPAFLLRKIPFSSSNTLFRDPDAPNSPPSMTSTFDLFGHKNPNARL